MRMRMRTEKSRKLGEEKIRQMAKRRLRGKNNELKEIRG